MNAALKGLHPIYPHNPIVDPECLSLLLNTPLETLKGLADSAPNLYRPVPQRKKDGSLRMTYDAHPPLKRVQHGIVTKILRKVRFPRYLHGGIRDREYPRDQVSNASQHAGAAILILDDIADFYPSLNKKLVFNIWLRFFGFSPDVAELLTGLTTYQGVIPQGAKTSSYLANLAFWNIEGLLVEKFQAVELTYSRFVDDVTLSSRTPISNHAKTTARSMVYGMLASKNCRPKRSKSHIHHKGQQLVVTGLVANAAVPAVDKKERRRIRAAVHNLEAAAKIDGMTFQNQKIWRQTKGRVVRLVRLQHPEGQILLSRLNAMHPQ